MTTEDVKQLEEITINSEICSDPFYKTCLYNLIFIALRYFGIDTTRLVGNDYFVYTSHIGKPLHLQRINRFFIPEEDILQQLGVQITDKMTSSACLNAIAALTKGLLAVIPVDRFEWTSEYNGKFYHKRHYPHYFLITAYYATSGQFIFFDSDIMLGISKKRIAHEELERCYQSYLDNFSEREIMIFGPESTLELECRKDEILHRFCVNYIEKQFEIVKGLGALAQSATYLGHPEARHEILNLLDSFVVADSFFTLEQYIMAEQFQYSLLFGASDEFRIYNQKIFLKLSLIKNIIIKGLMTNKLSNRSMTLIAEHLKDIYVLALRSEEYVYADVTNVLQGG